MDSRDWRLNGISWVYNMKLDCLCPKCDKAELIESGFMNIPIICDSCGYRITESALIKIYKEKK